ncbi:carboxypeptidase-like regulatory domain-containing protein [Cesiribacter sp. SM1]|uniref:carboxypeptidase-like regulatory domain-containing protein n=1 Tax=Cesiribacter sp. SM1 TaxID=2861196 RepID=UPI001CD7D4D2|nr:carboxypeptidase-like regulatory domain-containing protein [Cesiribacter sp. SM1]
MTTPSFKVVLLIASYCFILFSCLEEEETPAPDAGTEVPYAVTGTVVDTKGNPMAGVKVRADNDALYGSAEVTTDANGKYTLPKLEIGGWKIYAWKEVSYKGKTYHLRMGMPAAADYNAFSPGKEGAVKNFRWQLSGPIPDRPRSERSGSGYFGGTLLFTNLGPDAVQMPSGTVVTVTLTPVAGATLLDGSAPEVIKKSFTIEEGEYNYWIHDIAQCEYRITAESKFNGATKEVLLGTSAYSGHKPAIESFYFPPSLGSSGDYENGLLSSNDHPFFMHQP